MVPCVNSVMRPELTKMAPEGVEIYETRMLMRGTDKLEQLAYMVNSLPDNVEALADVADVYVYGCTSGSFTKGYEFDRELVDRIRQQSGKPATSAASSLVQALQAVEARSVVLATPYLESVNQLQVDFLQAVGVTVVKAAGLSITQRGGAGRKEPECAFAFAKETFRESGGADAVVISCTNFRTAEIIRPLEEELGVPVITSNQASLWSVLRAGGIPDPIRGYGRLLEL